MCTTPSSDELAAWIRLTLEPGIGAASIRNLLSGIGLPQDVYSASTATLAKIVAPELAAQLRAPLTSETQDLIERTLEWARQPGHHLLTLADAAYPPALLDTHDPPAVLYINGDAQLLQRPIISIVGARSATPGGRDNARAFARHLAERGWCIASGLALGIDTAAHEGALLAGHEGGSTIAVMGTGIDIVYPSANLKLAHKIAQVGALVSEFPLGTPSMPHNFPRRNRIVAGLARGVLVVEAARQSGSLITARLGSELGREVFAIPGSIHSPLSRGCHLLIRQGAKLVESGEDIHEELDGPTRTPQSSRTAASAQKASGKAGGHADGLRRPASKPAATASNHAKLFDKGSPEAQILEALGHDPVDADTLQRRTGLGISQLSGLLVQLELHDEVARLDDGRYQRQQT